MALLFAGGSLCFLIGPFPGYVALVGPRADAVTFFAGSILFTAGGALQTGLAFAERDLRPELGRHRLPRLDATRVVAGPGQAGLVGAVGQPARLRPVRDLSRRRLCRPRHRLAARSGRRELEHGRRSGVLRGLRAGDVALRPHVEVATAAARSRARGDDRARRGAAGVTRFIRIG
jgi:hypothetical protein